MVVDNACQQAILDAFYAHEYGRALQLCIELLRSDSGNIFALTYLAKIETAWKGDSSIPIELRLQLHRAERLVKLRRYTEARAAYEALRAELDGLNKTQWPALEEAILRLDRFEAVAQVLEDARAYLAQDQWEAALERCQQAQAMAPDLEYIQTEYIKIRTVLEQTHHVMVLSDTSVIITKQQVDTLLQALFETRMLLVQWPTSGRLHKLVLNIEARVAELRQKLIAEARDCFTLLNPLPGLQVARGILRRVRTLLAHLEKLPDASLEVEDLYKHLYQCEAEVGFAGEFEGKLAHWLELETDERAVSQMDYEMPSARLPDMTYAVRQIRMRWQYIDAFLPEYEFCLRALMCDRPESIARFARDTTTNLNDRPDVKWLSQWREARTAILCISEGVARWLGTGNSAEIRAAYCQLEDLTFIVAHQILPLRQLASTIALQWSQALREVANQQGGSDIVSG